MSSGMPSLTQQAVSHGYYFFSLSLSLPLCTKLAIQVSSAAPLFLSLNSKCYSKEKPSRTEKKVLILFYPHYIREISRIVYKNTCHAIRALRMLFLITECVLYNIRLTTNAKQSYLVNSFADFPDVQVRFCAVVGVVSLQQHLSLYLCFHGCHF